MADGRKHALDLVLPAFVQRQLDPRRGEAACARRRRAAVFEVDAFGKAA
jgi:hypothetical protein